MLNPELGTYGKGVIVIEGAFRINGVLTPDDIRDYNSNEIESVTRVSAGLFEVKLAKFLPYLPAKIVVPMVILSGDTTPTGAGMKGELVDGTWNTSTRTFRIVTSVGGAATDPEDNTSVAFYFRGSILRVGTD